jgi:hypothetical protein
VLRHLANSPGGVFEHVIERQKQLEYAKYFYSTSRCFRFSSKHVPSHSMIQLGRVTTLDSRLRGDA